MVLGAAEYHGKPSPVLRGNAPAGIRVEVRFVEPVENPVVGIMIRKSILLLDFARSHIVSGTPIREAVLLACETRLRPIILTALAVILGESVLYFDPILQGIGVTLPAGALFSTALTLGM